MKNSMLKKGLLIGLITLFLSAGIFPSINGNVIIEKNKQNIIDTQKLDISDISFFGFVIKVGYLGKIYNLTFDEEGQHYRFETRNIREFIYY